MGRIQKGYAYEASGTFFVLYYDTQIIDGQPKCVQLSKELRAGNGGVYSEDGALCKNGDRFYVRKVRNKKTLSHHLALVLNSFMQTVNA
jgi:hypothetical protein